MSICKKTYTSRVTRGRPKKHFHRKAQHQGSKCKMDHEPIERIDSTIYFYKQLRVACACIHTVDETSRPRRSLYSSNLKSAPPISPPNYLKQGVCLARIHSNKSWILISTISISVVLAATGLECVGCWSWDPRFRSACDHRHFSILIRCSGQGHLLQNQRLTSSPHQGGLVSEGSQLQDCHWNKRKQQLDCHGY